MFGRLIHQGFFGKWVVAGILIGVVAGIGAILFYLLIQIATNLVLGGITGFYPPGPAGEAQLPDSLHPNFLLVPLSLLVGGLASGLIIYSLAPEAEGHGTDAAIEAFHRKDGYIRKRVPLVKMVASAFTIGSGGSAGREGPTAQIAAGFGSLISDIMKLPVKDRRIAVAVGIGAGIGSIFKSPFGGAILSSEILYSAGDFESSVILPSFIASPVGYVIFSYFTSFTPVFGNMVSYSFIHPQNLIFYALLGLVCGIVGRLYSSSFYFFKKVFEGLRVPRYIKPAIGALLAGIIGIFFPEILGLGYGFLQYLINGNLSLITINYLSLPLMLIILLVVFLKIIATSLTVGSGGSGGVFAPALVIGGFIGAFTWLVINYLVPSAIPIPAPLVIVGMMAFFAGVGRAPIASILMVSEMTGTLNLLAPSMVAAVVSYFVCGSKYTIYRSQVPTRAESPAHRGEYNIPLLKNIRVSEAMNTVVVCLSENDTAEMAYKIMVQKGFKGIPVVDSNKVVGIVTFSDLLRVERSEMPRMKLKDVMTKRVIVAYPEETLYDALRRMTLNEIGRLPVVSKDSGLLIGIITRSDIASAYERAMKHD